MQQLINQLAQLNLKLNTFLWDRLGLVLLIFTGLYFTFSLRFFQIRYFFYWITKPFKKRSKTNKSNSISEFQALCTSLASTVGVGSIVGVAAAIYTGGSGAIFWMWVAAFISMMTAYAENVLGIYFREKNKNGTWQGGAMYILKNSFGKCRYLKLLSKILGFAFVVFCIFASFGIGNLGQVNQITQSIVYSFPNSFLTSSTFFSVPLYNLFIGIALAVVCSFVILGGIKRIAGLTEKLIPFMVLFFLIGSTVVIITFRHNLVNSFVSIMKNAFSFKAAAGGTGGYLLKNVITTGFKRGLFSTEAGMGSTVLINVSSNIKEPAEQGMWSIFQVFVDTFVICTLTALVILCTNSHHITFLTDSVLVAHSFSTVFGDFGHKFVAISIFLFAFSSVIGWSQYATQAISFFNSPRLINIYKAVFIVIIPFGAITNSEFVWNICDTFNALMMIPNLVATLVLSPLVFKITDNYIQRHFMHKNIPPMQHFKSTIK